MKKTGIVLVTSLLAFSCYLLEVGIGKFPAMARIVNPFSGCWRNAITESTQAEHLFINGMKDTVDICFDDRLVPHLFARNAPDAFFIQGYLHARYRLWQMDMTARLAGGRLSEVAGKKTLASDRNMRRKGMVWGAKQSLQSMQQDSMSSMALRAYTLGVNQWIASLNQATLPLEYKLMGFEPEAWTSLKTCLIMKFMADKLSGKTEDFELSVARQLFGKEFDLLYPEHMDVEYPVIPGSDGSGRKTPTGFQLHDTIHLSSNTSDENIDAYSDALGSNNWAISGKKSKSGKPILCNDPHLPLNLPSIWYENQLHFPGCNVYGVSLPGAPAVVIGFNDSIAWGFTNGYRDVKDYYRLKWISTPYPGFQNGQQVEAVHLQKEIIYICNEKPFTDSVYYTSVGPVQYDPSFPKPGFENDYFAMQWMGHRGSNELKSLLLLNQATNYTSFVHAISHFDCPHQNMVFASASGDIAMWSQGKFNVRKEGEGRFVASKGEYIKRWNQWIPFQDNPHEINPARGFVMSANQINTPASYPWYYHGIFTEERACRLHHVLNSGHTFSVRDMMDLQTDTYWQDASEIIPLVYLHLQHKPLQPMVRTFLSDMKQWDYRATAHSVMATRYQLFEEALEKLLYEEWGSEHENVLYPKKRILISILKNPELYSIVDQSGTPAKEDITFILSQAICTSEMMYKKLENKEWYRYKHTTARHLAQLPAFSISDIVCGGGKGMINAASSLDGPSWRMIVHFTQPVEAWGIYHAGQSGNPGSRYYDQMTQEWAKGHYYRIRFLHQFNEG
ncbi:MAG TPA: penicillin acylase family protein, partial [Chitinophagaceae bacterium]|nr:penicillin acylase family protein [Chitinophagaceae bacterium]